MGGNPKQRLKSFFKTKTMSAHGVEFLRMFGIPFLRMWDPMASVDDALAAFFNVDKRTVIVARAKRAFRMPGAVALTAGGKWSNKARINREVTKGQTMVIVMDLKDQTAKVDVDIEGKERTFRLLRPEVEFLKDQIEWRLG
jgi:hypothetical protein